MGVNQEKIRASWVAAASMNSGLFGRSGDGSALDDSVGVVGRRLAGAADIL